MHFFPSHRSPSVWSELASKALQASHRGCVAIVTLRGTTLPGGDHGGMGKSTASTGQTVFDHRQGAALRLTNVGVWKELTQAAGQ